MLHTLLCSYAVTHHVEFAPLSGGDVWAADKLPEKEADMGQVADEEATPGRGSLHCTPLSSGLVVARYRPWVAAL